MLRADLRPPNIAPTIPAAVALMRPEAIGRSFLVGWCRSSATSRMSFKTYVALETRQKISAASKTCRQRSQRVRLWEKMRAAKMNPFFTHCWGRKRFHQRAKRGECGWWARPEQKANRR